MAKIPETGPVTIAQIAAEWQGPEDLAELSKKSPLLKSGTEEVSVDDFRGEYYYYGTEAVGGDITTDGEYRYHTFTTAGTFEITKGGFGQDYNTVDVIIVGGGGGCGCPYNTGGSGGGVGGAGAGGVITASFASEPVTKTVSRIGAGGRSEPTNYKNYGQRGGDTEVVGYTVAAGGGATGSSSSTNNPTARDGGCSGGRAAGGSSSASPAPAPNPTGQGYAGGASGKSGVAFGGGGGGAGGAGGAAAYTETGLPYPPQFSYTAGGNGGIGKLWHGVRYSGGGGGGGNPVGSGMGGNGGDGGGGKAATQHPTDTSKLLDPGAPTDFWGGGAGASGITRNPDNSYKIEPVYTGYQGVVIFRYKVIPDVTRDTEFADRTFAPAIEPHPDYDSMTHYAELNVIENPRQKSVGWTVYELTEEQKADNVRAREEMKEMEQMED